MDLKLNTTFSENSILTQSSYIRDAENPRKFTEFE